MTTYDVIVKDSLDLDWHHKFAQEHGIAWEKYQHAIECSHQMSMEQLEGAAGSSDITKLRHVRTSAEKREAEEIASREKCLDFEKFKPLFERVHNELEGGVRTTRRFVNGSRSSNRMRAGSATS